MDSKVISYILGKLSWAVALALLLPLGAAIGSGEQALAPFLTAIAAAGVTGSLLRRYGRAATADLTVREGLAITTLGWILVTFLGMLPYTVGGYLSILDGILESISGLSGTGATVFNDLTHVPAGILLWRAETHWLGGLGIIVIFIALFPQMGRGTIHLFNAESTGPSSARALPRIKEMARALFRVYVGLTMLAFAALKCCGLSFLAALEHAFSTIATGGFSPYNDSAAHFHSPLIEGVLIMFMLLSSANFGIYVAVRQRGIRVLLQDTEFRCYLGIVVTAAIAITLNLIWQMGMAPPTALRQAAFQAVSLSSSTGFISADFDTWPSFSKLVILGLMFIGGCGGSTAGGFKVTRVMLLCHMIREAVRQKIHPGVVVQVRSNHSEVSSDLILGVARFFFVYVMLDLLWTILLTWNGVPLFAALGVSISTMGSCGPAFGIFGATCTYAALPAFGKVIVCVSMLMGRLESFTVLALLMPSFWQRRKGW